MRRRDASRRGVRVAAAVAAFLVALAGSAGAAPVSPPTSLTATALSSSQIRLNWVDTNNNEEGYFVERSLSSTSGFSQIASLAANATSYTSTGLAAGTTYYYRVRGSFKNGTYSAYSNVASARTTSTGTAPAAPSNLAAAAASSTQINLAWTDNSTNETGFKVERALSSAGPWTYIGSTASTGYGASGLAASTLYYFRVQAYNSYGNSAYSNTAWATTQGTTSVPSAPSSLTASAASSSQINLAWADTSSNETGFKIERSTATASWAQIATVGNVTSYASTALVASTAYSYRVRSYNTAGSSAYSNTASATTPAAGSSSLWSKRYGNTADDRGQTVAVDAQGRTAVTGSFYGATNFGGGTVASAICCGGSTSTMDIFVAQYAPSGSYLWARVIGSTSDEAGKGVATDLSGNVILTGYQGSYSVDYGGGPQYNHGGNDVFFAKYSSAGSWVWSKTIGGTGYEQGNAVAVDGSGNVFATGYIGTAAAGVDFGGGPIFSAGLYDMFLVKYSPTGQHIWSKRFGGSGNDTGMAISTDGSGNVIVAGSFEGTAAFGGSSFSSSGMRDVFVAKFSSTGAHLWSKKFGGSGDEVGYGVAVDTAGDIALSGKFQSSVNFGGASLTSAGGDDVYLAKLSGATGGHVWSKRMGSTSSDASIGVDVDGSGNVVMTGYFTGSVNFGGTVLSSSGIDVFVAKYSSAGAHTWSKRFGGFDTQIPNGVAVGPSGAAIVTGYFASTIDFGTGVLTSQGAYDAFLTNVGP
jgi:hypothetical protein